MSGTLATLHHERSFGKEQLIAPGMGKWEALCGFYSVKKWDGASRCEYRTGSNLPEERGISHGQAARAGYSNLGNPKNEERTQGALSVQIRSVRFT